MWINICLKFVFLSNDVAFLFDKNRDTQKFMICMYDKTVTIT